MFICGASALMVFLAMLVWIVEPDVIFSRIGAFNVFVSNLSSGQLDGRHESRRAGYAYSVAPHVWSSDRIGPRSAGMPPNTLNESSPLPFVDQLVHTSHAFCHAFPIGLCYTGSIVIRDGKAYGVGDTVRVGVDRTAFPPVTLPVWPETDRVRCTTHAPLLVINRLRIGAAASDVWNIWNDNIIALYSLHMMAFGEYRRDAWTAMQLDSEVPPPPAKTLTENRSYRHHGLIEKVTKNFVWMVEGGPHADEVLCFDQAAIGRVDAVDPLNTVTPRIQPYYFPSFGRGYAEMAASIRTHFEVEARPRDADDEVAMRKRPTVLLLWRQQGKQPFSRWWPDDNFAVVLNVTRSICARIGCDVELANFERATYTEQIELASRSLVFISQLTSDQSFANFMPPHSAFLMLDTCGEYEMAHSNLALGHQYSSMYLTRFNAAHSGEAWWYYMPAKMLPTYVQKVVEAVEFARDVTRARTVFYGNGPLQDVEPDSAHPHVEFDFDVLWEQVYGKP
jgi:hypothetical protein